MAEHTNDSMQSHFDQNRHIRVRRMEDILEGLTEPEIPPKFSWKSFDQGGTAVMIFNWVMVANIVMILFCIIYKRASSDDTYISRHQPTIDQQKEEAKRRRKIFKLYYSENIQQKISREQIRNDSCKTLDVESSSDSEEFQKSTDGSEDGDYIYDEEQDHGTVIILPYATQTTNAKASISTDNSDEEMEETKGSEQNNEKSVANLCTICLEPYEEGDTIVWSSNKNCPHAFHRACLTNYLVKVKDEKSYPCPICRQNFFFGNDKCKKTCEGVCEEV